MGDKSAAKAVMEKAEVPIVHGYHGGNQAPGFLLAEAARIGFASPLSILATGAAADAVTY